MSEVDRLIIGKMLNTFHTLNIGEPSAADTIFNLLHDLAFDCKIPKD